LQLTDVLWPGSGNSHRLQLSITLWLAKQHTLSNQQPTIPSKMDCLIVRRVYSQLLGRERYLLIEKQKKDQKQQVVQ
jgi:hypothetical protein